MSTQLKFNGQQDLVGANTGYPENVGIMAMDIFFPKQYIEQAALEQHDNVSAGKYTIGLGQTEMAFCSTSQDIYSLMLSAVESFMRKFQVDYKAIGHLEVGTETIMDHSKSIKTVLMQLFEESGNTDMEGIDCTNACYGGTNALFNAVNWVESSAWDGRYALVVCGDIAEYASGPARPTGGAGVVVMLVGAQAALALDRGVRSSHMEHAWDFYKPNLSSPFPVVDGHLSQTCYLAALDVCFQRFTEKFQKRTGKPFTFSAQESTAAHFVFHSPYNKLVQKSFARLYYLASLLKLAGDNQAALDEALSAFPKPAAASVLPLDRADAAYTASLTDRDLEKALVTMAKGGYASRVAPAADLPQRLGNMYTASLYAGLLSLVSNKGEALAGQRVVMFSYGSGLAASMFSVRVGDDAVAKQQLRDMQVIADVSARLTARSLKTPVELNAALDEREARHHCNDAFTPAKSEELWEGEFYLVSKDAKGKRVYARA